MEYHLLLLLLALEPGDASEERKEGRKEGGKREGRVSRKKGYQGRKESWSRKKGLTKLGVRGA